MNDQSVKQTSPEIRLPGRFYTFVVTCLAVGLTILPFAAERKLQWKTTAVIEHTTQSNFTVAEATVVDGIQSAIDAMKASTPNLELPNAHEIRINLSVSSIELANPTETRTTLTLETHDRQVSSEILTLLSNRLISEVQTGGRANLISLTTVQQVQLGRAELLTTSVFAVCFGLITLFYPRIHASQKRLLRVNEIETITETPVLGTVFPDDRDQPQQKSSAAPLRLTVFAAEIIVAAAFLLMLYLAASNTDFAKEFAQTPLESYAQGVLTFTSPASPEAIR